MPAVPENSGLLTGILDSDSVEDLDSVEVSQDLDSVEVSKDRDIESPESTSQVIISRCVYKCILVVSSGSTTVTGFNWDSTLLSSFL